MRNVKLLRGMCLRGEMRTRLLLLVRCGLQCLLCVDGRFWRLVYRRDGIQADPHLGAVVHCILHVNGACDADCARKVLHNGRGHQLAGERAGARPHQERKHLERDRPSIRVWDCIQPPGNWFGRHLPLVGERAWTQGSCQ